MDTTSVIVEPAYGKRPVHPGNTLTTPPEHSQLCNPLAPPPDTINKKMLDLTTYFLVFIYAVVCFAIFRTYHYYRLREARDVLLYSVGVEQLEGWHK